MKKYLPILVLILGSLLVHFAAVWGAGGSLLVVLRALVCFTFGVSMAVHRHGRQYTWLKKVIVAFVVFFVMVWQMGVIVFPELAGVFETLGLTDFGFSLIYIYCGWIFFD